MFSFDSWVATHIAGLFNGFERQIIREGMVVFARRSPLERSAHTRGKAFIVSLEPHVLQALKAANEAIQAEAGRRAQRHLASEVVFWLPPGKFGDPAVHCVLGQSLIEEVIQ